MAASGAVRDYVHVMRMVALTLATDWSTFASLSRDSTPGRRGLGILFCVIGETMLQRWALCALVLALSASWSSNAWAQTNEQRQTGSRKAGMLGPNQPNPVATETTISFRIGDDSCESGQERHVVTLRIYNILSQLVAIPVLVDSLAGGDSTRAVPPALTNLPLPCGAYAARWDGRQANTGAWAAPGVYMYQLIIDGHPTGMRKMVVARP